MELEVNGSIDLYQGICLNLIPEATMAVSSLRRTVTTHMVTYHLPSPTHQVPFRGGSREAVLCWF